MDIIRFYLFYQFFLFFILFLINCYLLAQKFTFISFIILAATMFSSFNISLHFDFFSKQQIIFLSIITIISCIIICHDISVIKNICTIVIPIILILMLSICFSNFNIPQNTVVLNIILLPYNTITYVCRNIFLSYFVICKSSKGFTEKQCKQVSFFTSLILCCVLSIVLVIEINPDLVLSSMPLLDLAQNSILYYPYLIGLLFAVFTTLISTLVTLKSFFHFRSNFLNALCPTLICVLLSFIKFDYFVVYLYPIIGIFGFYLLYYLMSFDVFFQNSNKNIHKASKQTKNKRT